MSLQNITIDDFDSVLSWSSKADWSTPDPQDNPSWFSEPDVTEWHEATYHKTSVVGTSVFLNFTGPSLYIYGASGPTYGSYSIQLDSSNAITSSAYASSNVTGRFPLYAVSDLSYGPHTLELKNLGSVAGGEGSELLVDLFVVGSEVGAAGATLTNTTLQETDSRITYTGTWDNNTNELFSGGGTTYTNTDSSFSFSFEGSAVWIFGDQVNDHGLFTVSINGSWPETYDNGSGCGGAFGKTCEKLGTLAYFKGSLGEGTHTVEVVNLPGVNNSFIDIDQIIYTTPSIYADRTSSNSSSNSTTTPASSSSSSLSPSASAAAAASATGSPSSGGLSIALLGPLAWGVMGLLWVGRGMRL